MEPDGSRRWCIHDFGEDAHADSPFRGPEGEAPGRAALAKQTRDDYAKWLADAPKRRAFLDALPKRAPTGRRPKYLDL